MKRVALIISTFLILLPAAAQVPVREEPRHHLVFENKYVRILDVHLEPGDTTLYHLHATPSVFIYLSNTRAGSRLSNQPAVSSVNIAGNISYDSLVTPRIHQVWNEDSTWFHVMDVELVNPFPAAIQALPVLPKTELLFDKPRVIGYRVQISNTEIFRLQKVSLPCLLISLGDATLKISRNREQEIRVMKAGHYEWIRPGGDLVIQSDEPAPAKFAWLVFK